MGYLVKEVVLSSIINPVVSNSIKIAPFVLSLLGMFLGFIIYSFGLVFKRGRRVLYTFFNSAWQFNYIVNNFFVDYI